MQLSYFLFGSGTPEWLKLPLDKLPSHHLSLFEIIIKSLSFSLIHVLEVFKNLCKASTRFNQADFALHGKANCLLMTSACVIQVLQFIQLDILLHYITEHFFPKWGKNLPIYEGH